MKPRQKEKLEEVGTASSKAAIAAGGAVGAAVLAPTSPGLALALGVLLPVITEFFGVVMPQKRMHRVETMLAYLHAKEAKINAATLKDKLDNDEEFAAIFERGGIQASMAHAELRLEAIAGIVASQFRDSSKSLEADKCLSIIEQLDDLELYLLLEVHYFNIYWTELWSNTKMSKGQGSRYRALSSISTWHIARSTNIWFHGHDNGYDAEAVRLKGMFTGTNGRPYISLDTLCEIRHLQLSLLSLEKLTNMSLLIKKPVDSQIDEWTITGVGYMIIRFIENFDTAYVNDID